jgi:hypothetical protein
MAINSVGESKSVQPPAENTGVDPKSVDGMQARLNDIKDGKSANPKEDLKNLKQDVDQAMQKEESKPNGGDDQVMKLIEALLKMVMAALKQSKGGGAGGGEGEE